jgi:hypothetical protein
MRFVVAEIGGQALYLLFIWLASAIATSYTSGRKGYGERVGLASGMLLPVISVIAWIVVPAKPESDWKVVGAFGRQEVGTEGLADPQTGAGPAGGPGPSSSPS